MTALIVLVCVLIVVGFLLEAGISGGRTNINPPPKRGPPDWPPSE